MNPRAIVTSAGAAALSIAIALAIASPADAAAPRVFRGANAGVACYHAGQSGVEQGLWSDFDCLNFTGEFALKPSTVFYLITR